MGRPPLGIISTTVRLPKAVLEKIDALLGENRRAQFIREAVEMELARREAPAEEPAAQIAAKPKAQPAAPKKLVSRLKGEWKAP